MARIRETWSHLHLPEKMRSRREKARQSSMKAIKIAMRCDKKFFCEKI